MNTRKKQEISRTLNNANHAVQLSSIDKRFISFIPMFQDLLLSFVFFCKYKQ